jgi:RNA polymerase sigma factor (sigma-70 family)
VGTAGLRKNHAHAENDQVSRRSPHRTLLWGEQFSDLLDAAKAGAEWAWADLYDGLAPVVLGYLRGRGAFDPDDLLGETFLHAVRSVSRFEGDEGAFKAWLLEIARRRLVDDFRYKARRPVVPAPQEELAEMAGAVRDAVDVAMERVEVQRVLVAIRRLSPDQQDVLILRFVGGLSLEEVARIVDKRLSAVKALQRRGLASLHRKISPQGVSG